MTQPTGTPASKAATSTHRPHAGGPEAGAFTLSGWLEPAATIAGDTFDYSLSRDVPHFSVTDAMGHGVESALTATLGVGSLRNSRRRGWDLVAQAVAANAAVAEHGGVDGMFMTAVLGRLDLTNGNCGLVNAGHPPPLLVRHGREEPLPLTGDLPLGVLPGSAFHSGTVTLPGDRLVVVTDGMWEREAGKLDLTAELRQVADLHPREAARALADVVLRVAGPILADDATLLIIDWCGDHEQVRHSSGGADPARASRALPG